MTSEVTQLGVFSGTHSDEGSKVTGIFGIFDKGHKSKD